MPLPIVGGFAAWLVGLFGSSLGGLVTWLMSRMVYERALQITLVTGFLVAASALTVTLAVGIKAAIYAARISMPGMLAGATYFLPMNINVVLSLIVTARVSMSLYRWTVATLAAYLPGSAVGVFGRGVTG